MGASGEAAKKEGKPVICTTSLFGSEEKRTSACGLRKRVQGILCIQHNTNSNVRLFHPFTTAVLAQSVERLTAEREVVGSIPGAGLILRVLK